MGSVDPAGSASLDSAAQLPSPTVTATTLRFLATTDPPLVRHCPLATANQWSQT